MLRKSKHPEPLAEFVTLLTNHQAFLRGYVRSLLPNASDIQDVVQNTNIVLWERREEYEAGTNFKAWACAVARYRAMEHRKLMAKDSQLVFSDDLLQLISGKVQEKSVDAEEQIHQALEQCVKKLSDANKALIIARYAGKQSLEEYAEQDGRTYQSIPVILNRLRQKLRTCIDLKLSEAPMP